jgi:effector-binding domain-containing protein
VKETAMLEIKRIEAAETPYLYEERSCKNDPAAVGAAMGEAFGHVWAFMTANQIKPAGGALSVYYTFDPSVMTFRAGFTIGKDDATKANGAIKADVTPAGPALTFTHIGPYSGLRASYQELMRYMAQNGISPRPPMWEMYLNSPEQVPEDQLQTAVFAPVA